MKCGSCHSYEGWGARHGCETCRAYNLSKVDEAIADLRLNWGDDEVREARLEEKKKAHRAKRKIGDWIK